MGKYDVVHVHLVRHYLSIQWSEVPAFPHECNGLLISTCFSLHFSTQDNFVPPRLSPFFFYFFIWDRSIVHFVLHLARKINLQCHYPILIILMAENTNFSFKPAAIVSCHTHLWYLSHVFFSYLRKFFIENEL